MTERTQAIASSRRTVAVFWGLAAIAVAVAFWSWLTDLTLPGTHWQQPGAMADFRDTIWGPGSYLLDGGNPYDPDRYLALHPWAQEFDPYAPAWLLLSATLSLLSFSAAATTYLLIAAVLAVVLLRMLAAWAVPSLVPLLVPLGLVYLTIWSPGRYALENGGTLLVVIGWVLVMRAVVEDRCLGGSAHRSSDGLVALGLALSLLKPQFGLPLIVVLAAAARWRALVFGGIGLFVVSLPVIVACSVAAGGLGAFLGSIGRLVSYASSPTASTGLLSPYNERIDLLGTFARITGSAPGTVATLLVALVAATVCALLVRRAAQPVALCGGIAAATLLGLVHQPYDQIILLAPALLGVGVLLARRNLPRPDRVVWVATLVPVLHVYGITTLIVPAMSRTDVQMIDFAALCVVLATTAAASVASPRMRDGVTAPRRNDGE